MKLRDIADGDKFSARIQGRSVTGTVRRNGSSNIYLCNNFKGYSTQLSDRDNKKYTWLVGANTNGNPDFAAYSVTQFTITSKVVSKAPAKKAAPKKSAKVAIVLSEEAQLDAEQAALEAKLAAIKAKKAASKLQYEQWTVKKISGAGSTARYQFGCGAVRFDLSVMMEWAEVTRTIAVRTGCILNAYETRALALVDRIRVIEGL